MLSIKDCIFRIDDPGGTACVIPAQQNNAVPFAGNKCEISIIGSPGNPDRIVLSIILRITEPGMEFRGIGHTEICSPYTLNGVQENGDKNDNDEENIPC